MNNNKDFKGKNIAYIRVSTAEQNTERQKEALKNIQIDKFFEEKISAKDTNRPKLQEMLNYVREGDTVYVHDFSRLARSTKDLLEIIEFLNKKEVKLLSNKESFDTHSSTGKMMVTMLGAIYEFERANLLERQREGIAIAKANGRYKGRKPVDKPTNWDEIYSRWRNRELKTIQAIKLLGLKESTFYKFAKESV